MDYTILDLAPAGKSNEYRPFLYEKTYESWRLHKTSIAQVSRKCLRGKLRHFLKEIHVIEKSIFKNNVKFTMEQTWI